MHQKSFEKIFLFRSMQFRHSLKWYFEQWEARDSSQSNSSETCLSVTILFFWKEPLGKKRQPVSRMCGTSPPLFRLFHFPTSARDIIRLCFHCPFHSPRLGARVHLFAVCCYILPTDRLTQPVTHFRCSRVLTGERRPKAKSKSNDAKWETLGRISRLAAPLS